MPYKDENKRKEYKKRWNKEHYRKNTQKEKDRTKSRKLEMRKWFSKYKNTRKCERCGENHIACLEFHHNDGSDKKFEISGALSRDCYSKSKILSEIDKCTVLCANCHRKHHFERDTC